MRRIAAIGLLVSFILQTSGAALAGQTGPTTPSLRFEFAAEIAAAGLALQGHLGASRIFAQLSGAKKPLNASHAPRPVFKKPIFKNPISLARIRGPHAVMPANVRRGILVKQPTMVNVRTFDFKHLPKDPLAMPHLGAKAQALSTVSKVTPGPITNQAISRGSPEVVSTPASMTTFSSTASRKGARAAALSLDTSTPATTGTNPWWTFESGTIPGGGAWLINVASGNLILQDTDVDVPERGVDLTFARTYNHEMGAQPSWGGGWTDTWSARMYYDAGRNELSVLDDTGARYDYCSNGDGGWNSCTAGEHAQLIFDGGCGYWWVQKSGVIYDFTSPTPMCGQSTGNQGRIYRIYGRNQNNWIQEANYWYNGDASSDSNLTEKVIFHSDGQSLSVVYSGDGSGNIQSVTRPDGQVVTYFYDENLNLSDVCQIGNGSIDANPSPCASNQEHVQYNGGNSVFGANWTASSGAAGAWVEFGDDDPTIGVEYTGVINPTPEDGTNTPLQSGISNPSTYRSDSLNYDDNETEFTDSDGHATDYLWGGSGQVTETDDWNGSTYLATLATWDNNNDLTSTTDPRGAATGSPSSYETNFAYDNNGNMIATALPATTVNGSSIRPTTLYSYDQYNDLTSVCDPTFANSHGLNWSSPPAESDTLCPNTGGATRYVYDYSDTAEPFGRLSDVYSALGYDSHISYDPGAQGNVDAGLPTQIQGASYSQNDGQGSRTPTKTFSYDGFGNALTSNAGSGAATTTYDSLNRPTSTVDADGAVTCRWYYADGQVSAIETPAQRALVSSSTQCSPLNAPDQYASTMSYDPDGNVAAEVRHFGCLGGGACTAGTTQYWYDGDDRLVEVSYPTDASDYIAWMTRYCYDLTQDGVVSIAGSPTFAAHGNLYKTQRYLPGTLMRFSGGTVTAQSDSVKVPAKGAQPQSVGKRPQNAATTARARLNLASGLTSTWMDVSATAYDPMDRQTAKYKYQVGGTSVNVDSLTYDTTAAGFLVQDTTPVGDVKSYGYDPDGQLKAISYQVGSHSSYTSNKTFGRDPNGHIIAITSDLGTLSTAYDLDGQTSSITEESGGSGAPGFPADTQISQGGLGQYSVALAYYPDGLLSTASSVAQGTSFTRSLSYRADGSVRTRNNSFLSGSTTYQYSPAGRLTAKSDPYGTDSRTYDSFGRVSGRTIPAGSYSSIGYDAEGDVVGYSRSFFDGYRYNPSPVTHSYNIRGESTDPNYLYNGTNATSGNVGYVDGVAVNPELALFCGAPGAPCTAQTPIVDTRNLVVAGTDLPGCCVNDQSNAHIGNWDADGRLNEPYAIQLDANGNPNVVDEDISTYDAENHLTEVTKHNDDGQTYETGFYLWGLGGHPIAIYNEQTSVSTGTVSGVLTQSLHWAGDDLLASAPIGASSPTDYFDGTDASYTTNAQGGTQYLDRGFEQYADAEHGNATTPPDIMFPRPDGFMDMDWISNIQGVRSFSQDTGEWSTPDQASGSISDPVSQAGYTWNRNSPLNYDDPTGFATCQDDKPCANNNLSTIVTVSSAAVGAGYGELSEGPAIYSVYGSLGKGADLPYVGFTNDYGRRAYEHGANGRSIQLLARGLTRFQARALEQWMITRIKLANLANKINGISPFRSIFGPALEQGEQIANETPAVMKFVEAAESGSGAAAANEGALAAAEASAAENWGAFVEFVESGSWENL